MIRLTRQADYGIVLLTRMVEGGPSGVHAASDLSAETGLPLPMVSKVLKVLGKAGLVESQRGAKGGYRLARPPARISVVDIIEALEGPIAMTECMTGRPGECEHEPLCRVQGAWKRINGVVMTALEKVSLADMVNPDPPRLVTIDKPRQAGAGLG